MTTIRSSTHAGNLLGHAAGLLNQPQYSDVQANVNGKTFYCHKLILAARSKYFKRKFCLSSTSSPANEVHITDISEAVFDIVLRYVYTGETEVSDDSVEDIYRAAEILEIVELREMCVNYMMDSLNLDNCISFWKMAEITREEQLASASKDVFLTGFSKTSQSDELCEMTEEMMKAAISDDSLCTNREVDVCEMLMKWLDNQTQRGLSVNIYELLTMIRWSDVPDAYVKSTLLKKDILIRNQKCFELLSEVISYHLSGVQFPGLRTFHRPSTSQERCVVTVGIDNGNSITSDVYRISLQRPHSVDKLPDIPTKMEFVSAACISNGMLFVTGVGSAKKETWMLNFVSGWSRHGDLVEGRRRHCATFVNNTEMYVLGGFDGQVSTKSVEQFKTTTNRWTTVGQLVHAVQYVDCILHKTSLLVFGGSVQDSIITKDTPLDCVQVYDTVTNVCTVLTRRLPRPECRLRAVMWNKSVILINSRTCLVFDLEQQIFQQRDQFATGMDYFGLVLDNERIFVIGGGMDLTDKDGKRTWTLTDEVAWVPVMNIINNRMAVNWTEHAKLPRPSLIQTFASCSLSTASMFCSSSSCSAPVSSGSWLSRAYSYGSSFIPRRTK